MLFSKVPAFLYVDFLNKRVFFLSDREWNPLFRRTVLIVFLQTFVPDNCKSFCSSERVSRGLFCTSRTKFLAVKSDIFVGRPERGRLVERWKDLHLRTVSPTVESGILNTDEILLYPKPKAGLRVLGAGSRKIFGAPFLKKCI